MNARIQKLDGIAAVQILRNIAQKWIETRGLEAFVVVDAIRREFGDGYENPPSWLLERPEEASDKLIALSKRALNAILEGEELTERTWVEDELADLREARAQMADPLSLGVIGATLIGMIVAARVEKFGNVTFYKGVPKEIVDIVRRATSILVPRMSPEGPESR